MSEQEMAADANATSAEDPNEAMDDQNRNRGADVQDDEAAPASAEFQNLEPDNNKTAEVNLDAILDVPVTIAMEIGRTRINIRNLLQLNQGSVVELDRLAGEPMDVLVNGTLIAQGEVVVVNDKLGIRLTDVISPADRVKRLA